MFFSDRIQTKLWSRALVYSGDMCVRMEAVQFTVVHLVFTFTFAVFSRGFYPKRRRFIHLFRHRRWRQPRNSQLAGSSQGEASCSGDTSTTQEPGGAGDQTSNLPVISQPALLPDPHAHPKPGSY